MENEEKITLSREELNAMLEEAAKRGAREAGNDADCGDPEDAEALGFISTFESGQRPLGRLIGRFLSGCESVEDSLRKKLDEYNEFEAHIEPYYAYADAPETVEDDLDEAEFKRYGRKHEIYLQLRDEKIRRFGLLGLQRGVLNASIPDEISFKSFVQAVNA